MQDICYVTDTENHCSKSKETEMGLWQINTQQTDAQVDQKTSKDITWRGSRWDKRNIYKNFKAED